MTAAVKREAVLRELRRQRDNLPPPGTPARQLTDQQQYAVAVLGGCPYEVAFEGPDGCSARLRTTRPVGIADRGDGGYIVAIGPAPRIFP